jgi:hypothetical protein
MIVEILNVLNRAKLGDMTDDETTARILWVLQAYRNVTIPDFGKHRISPEGMRLITAAIESEKMTKKLLSVLNQAKHGDLTANQAHEAILRVFQAFPGVTVLDLGEQRIGDEGVQLIAAAIESEHCSLTWLHLWDNNIGPQGVQYIANALSSPNCSIKVLNMNANRIGDLGAQYMANALISPNCSIQELLLDQTDIGDVGAQHLSLAIQSPQCPLKKLILPYNHIGPAGAQHLSAGIRHPDCTLKFLCLFSNNVGNVGAQHFISALLDYHCSIDSLKLGERNNIDPEILNATNNAARHCANRKLVRCLFELASACLKLGLTRDPVSIILSFAGEGEISSSHVSEIVRNAQKWNSRFFLMPSPPSWYGNLLRSAMTSCLPLQATARILSDIISVTRFFLEQGQTQENTLEQENQEPQIEILDGSSAFENREMR